MSKFSGAISSLVAIGVLSCLIYYCCIRRKRQRQLANGGTVIHVTTARVTGPSVAGPGQNVMPYGVVNQSQVNPVNPAYYPYSPASQGPVGQPMGQPGYPNNQPIMSGGYPNPAQNTPYPYPLYPPPVGPAMPMPMPMPLDNSSLQQGSIISYPNPTAPPQFNDLPPPYSDVTKR